MILDNKTVIHRIPCKRHTPKGKVFFHKEILTFPACVTWTRGVNVQKKKELLTHITQPRKNTNRIPLPVHPLLLRSVQVSIFRREASKGRWLANSVFEFGMVSRSTLIMVPYPHHYTMKYIYSCGLKQCKWRIKMKEKKEKKEKRKMAVLLNFT